MLDSGMSCKNPFNYKFAFIVYTTAVLVFFVCLGSYATPSLNRELGLFLDNEASRAPNQFLYAYESYWFYPSDNIKLEDVAEALKPYFPQQKKESVAVYNLWKSPAEGLQITFYLSENKFYISFPVEYSLGKSKTLFLKALSKHLAKTKNSDNVVFSTNPFLKFEQLAHKRLKKSKFSRFSFDVINSPNEYLDKTTPMNLIIPDIHGYVKPLDQVLKAMQTGKFDWIALEMLPVQIQFDLKKVKNHIELYWDSFHALYSTKRSYMEIINFAKKNNIQIIPLEDSTYYDTPSQRVDKLGLATRNQIWSSNTPLTGNGIIFGGLAHFAFRQNTNYQDFVSRSKEKTYFFYDWGLFDAYNFAKSSDGFSSNKLTLFHQKSCASFY